jgi:beta-glucanase (GH16 family)
MTIDMYRLLTAIAIVLCAAIGVRADKVVLFDDFDGANGSAPDSTLWNYCPPGRSAWNRHQSGQPAQAYVADGCLVLVAESTPDGYACGGVDTRHKFAMSYGRLEVRARIVNAAQGGWPAVWLMPESPMYAGWPECGEIDVMEHIDRQDLVHCTFHTWYGDVLRRGALSMTSTAPIDTEVFNVYAMEWTPSAITISVNGSAVITYPNLGLSTDMMQWPYATPFYIILNNSLGGRGTWPGPIDGAALPSLFLVDYVKVSVPD